MSGDRKPKSDILSLESPENTKKIIEYWTICNRRAAGSRHQPVELDRSLNVVQVGIPGVNVSLS